MYKLVRKILRLNILQVEQYRSASAWLNRARADPESAKTVDAEKLFINPDVQRLLTELTGMDLEKKVFKTRRLAIQQRSHYALMTEERLDQTMEKMREEAQRFLSFVPLKEPRSEEVTILSKDPEIEGFDKSKFVFTDITFDATDQDRTVVVREVDGTLRTATTEEHDRMNRTYYEKPNRPVFPPPVFEDPYLQNALDRKEHEFVLDWACWFYEPDDPAYISLILRVFDRVVEAGDFEVLHSTRHFGTLVFYLALNGNIPPLLNYFGARGRLQDCAKLVRLQKILHPDWRTAINSSDSDLKIVTDFVKENSRYRDQLKDLNAFLKDGTVIPSTSQNDEQVKKHQFMPKTTVDASNVRGTGGPLGELSQEYEVQLVKSEGEEEAEKGNKTEDRKERRGLRTTSVTPIKYRRMRSAESCSSHAKTLDFDWQPSGNAVLKVYNYWEPLHLLLFGKGLQTWEYSPVYAIRSYFYIYLHYIPANILYHLLPYSKIALFVTLRCCIGIFTLMAEFALYKAVCKHLSISIGRFFVIFSMLSTAFFLLKFDIILVHLALFLLHFSTAFLPSSFAMTMNMYAMAAFLNAKWFYAIFCTAVSALVGWPFAAALGLPIVLEMLVIRPNTKMFLYYAAVSGFVVCGSLLAVDSYYYGKRVLAPLNIVLYNVFSEHGPDLYGVEPLSYYLKNLVLNWNIAVLLVPLAIPFSALNYLFSWKAAKEHKKWGIREFLSEGFVCATLQP
ncbi:plasmid Maintenance Protein [Cooperia oncophora]